MNRKRRKDDDDEEEYQESEYEEEEDESEEYEDDDYDEDEIDDPDEIEIKHFARKNKNKQRELNGKKEKNVQHLGKKRNKDNDIKYKNPKEQKINNIHNKEPKPKEQKQKPKKLKENNDPYLDEIDANTPYNLETNYFIQPLSNSEWNKISSFLDKSLSNPSLSRETVEHFFFSIPSLCKGESNITKLLSLLTSKASKNKKTLLSSFQIINSFIISNYLMPKPSIFEVHFFPNPNNEIYVLKMLSTCKTSMDIAIFTMTNWKIAKIIENLFFKGIKIRIIADDECCKMSTSNIYQLAALGIPVKTDDSVRYHMHHKFAVIDNSVVITGSFNWTSQAVEHNQENVLFIENKELAKAYSDEFQRLWEYFEVVISRDNARRIIQEQEDKRKATEMRKLKEKMNKEGDGNIQKRILDEQDKRNKIEEKKIRDMKITEGRFNKVQNRNLLYENRKMYSNINSNNNIRENDTNKENSFFGLFGCSIF